MSDRTEKIVGWSIAGFVLAVIVGIVWLITWSVQKENKYDEWVSQCHNSGSVVVDIGGGMNRCMSWEEAEEKGVEFEVG